MAAYQGAGRGLIPAFVEVGALARWVEALGNDPGHLLIDGFPGSGKSTLARALAAELKLPHVEIDRLVTSQMSAERPRYIDNIDLQALSGAILAHPSTIIDGVTSLDFADGAAISLKAHVYVKHFDRSGKWVDDDEIELENEIDAVAPPGELRVSLRRYHVDRRPHETCGAIFVRQDPE